MKNNKGWIIAGGILLLFFIVAAAFASKANAAPLPSPTPTPNPSPSPQPQTPGNILDSVLGLFKKIFGNKTTPPYVQVQPIDEDGCDANGYNAIGVKCFGAF